MGLSERIEAWLRLRDTARFNRDARSAAESIDEIGDAADRTDDKLGGLGDGLDDFDTRLIDIGNQGHSVGNQLGFLGGRMGAIATIVVATLPIIVAFAGALTAVAGSATAALGGITALAVGGFGVLTVGLSGVGILLAQTAGDIEKVKTAWDAYNLAVEQYGKKSDEAKTAHQKLNAVVKENGGSVILQLVKRIGELGEAWRKLTRPALDSLGKIFNSATGMFKRFVPVFANITNQAAEAMERPMARFFKQMQSDHMLRALVRLGNAFEEAIGPMMRIFGNVLEGLANSAAAAAPFFVRMARGVARLTDRFAEWSRGGGPGELFGVLISHAKTWWGLIKSIGGLLAALFSGSATQGQGLVTQLTNVISKWTEWLNTKQGREELKKFMTEAIELTRQTFIFLGRLAGIIFRLAQIFMPVFIDAFKIANFFLGLFLKAINLLFTPLRILVRVASGPVAVLGNLKEVLKWIWNAGGKVFNGIKTGLSEAYDFIKPKIEWLIEKIEWLLNKVPDLPSPKDFVPFGGDNDLNDIIGPGGGGFGQAALPVGGTVSYGSTATVAGRPARSASSVLRQRGSRRASTPEDALPALPIGATPLVHATFEVDKKVLVDAVVEGVEDEQARR